MSPVSRQTWVAFRMMWSPLSRGRMDSEKCRDIFTYLRKRALISCFQVSYHLSLCLYSPEFALRAFNQGWRDMKANVAMQDCDGKTRQCKPFVGQVLDRMNTGRAEPLQRPPMKLLTIIKTSSALKLTYLCNSTLAHHRVSKAIGDIPSQPKDGDGFQIRVSLLTTLNALGTERRHLRLTRGLFRSMIHCSPVR